MIKTDAMTEIAKTGIDKVDVEATIGVFFRGVNNSMAECENIYVQGFGSFVNRKRVRKIVRNVTQNTAQVTVDHYVTSFKPSKV